MTLKVENLTLERGSRILQKGISLELSSGEALWVRGPNGVGKSTLLETLCGFIPICGGSVSWMSVPINEDMDRYHDALSYLGHKNGNNPSLTTHAALQFYAKLFQSDKLDEALIAMGLDNRADIHVRDLSAGQQRRLAVARLLLLDRPLWILDEPTVSLDQQGSELVAKLIEQHCAKGGMVIYTSHVNLKISAKEMTLEKMSQASLSQSEEFLTGNWAEVE